MQREWRQFPGEQPPARPWSLLDLRGRSLEERKSHLAGLLRGCDGIRLVERIEEDGARVFEHACRLGFEGIVSKRRGYWYRSGRCRTWIKVRNPDSPVARRLD